jgi:hypothetical protein
MMERIAEVSPRFKARIAGLFYLLTFLVGAAALSVSGGLVVSGDAAATASNLLAHERAFQLGVAADLIVIACYITVTALFYQLYKPVSTGISLLAAFFSLVGCAVQAVSYLFYLAPFVALGGAPYLNVFTTAQLQALSLMLLKLGTQAYSIGLVFFGFYCLLIGYLTFRSGFLPRILGVLMIFAGLGWLTFLSPSLAKHLYPYVLAPGVIGEGSLTLWLLLRGVNPDRWKQQALASAERHPLA